MNPYRPIPDLDEQPDSAVGSSPSQLLSTTVRSERVSQFKCYRIVNRIGSGETGAVFKAIDENLNLAVAIASSILMLPLSQTPVNDSSERQRRYQPCEESQRPAEDSGGSTGGHP